MAEVKCPYKSGDICNADVGKPVKVEEKSELEDVCYPHAYILNNLWEDNAKLHRYITKVVVLEVIVIILLMILLIIQIV